jgi:triacylglycerol lipase
MASPTSFWGSFFKVPEALRADGHTVFTPSLPPFDSVAVRSASLATQIDAALADSGAEKVNLIAHSMGGLDARAVVSTLGYGDRVASVTTIATPHRGSAVADVILGLLPGDADEALNAIGDVFASTFSDFSSNSHVREALTALAESEANGFNAATPDDPRVFYQSWTGVASVLGIPNPADVDACEGTLKTFQGRAYKMEALLVKSAAFVAHGTELLPNDGLVRVESGKWGTFRGCLPASHLSELGQVSLTRPDPRTGFDHLRFYRNIAFELSAKGF